MNTGKATNQVKPDPYASFRSDPYRLWALVSRDLRFVICTVVVMIWAPQVAPALLLWLWRMAKLS
jgi:hypothetical protein